MKKVLIVDDEYLAQAQMRHIINWESCGFCIESIASDGNQAIEILKDKHIDVVFTDVCMPVMDGIKLTKYIYTHFPEIKVVITSNYSDLNFVKEAFKYNAFDYILKITMTDDSIRSLLKKLHASLGENKPSYTESPSVQKPIVYNDYIKDVILGNKMPDNPILNSVIAVCSLQNFFMICHTHSPEEIKILSDNIINTISHVLKDLKDFVIFKDNENSYIIYMPFPKDRSETDIMNSLYSYIKHINYSIKKFFNMTFLWGISTVSSENTTLAECLKDASVMLTSNPIIDKNKSVKEKPLTLSIQAEKELLNSIAAIDEKKTLECLENIFTKDAPNNFETSIIFGELLSVGNKICMDYNIDIDEIFASFPADNSKIINSVKTAEEALAYCKDFYKKLLDIYISKAFPNRNSKYVKRVYDYIELHYAEPISAEQIAYKIGLSVSHLNSIFKAETTQSISTYLTLFRIEKAKQLLARDVDIKNIYSMVGFNNYNYFFVLFKKNVGMTPNDYKKHARHI